MSLFEVLEKVDRFMNAMDEKDYSRLLGLLSMMVHKLHGIKDESYGVAVLKEATDDDPITDQEKAIIKIFLDNKNLRPGILASLYSRVIMSNFKVNYVI